MADDYLAQYLLALEKEVAANDPYSRFGGVADALGGQVIKASPDYGLGESVGAAAILGLLGGGLDSMSQSYRADNLTGLNSVLQGRVSEQPSSLSNPLYRKALQYKDLIKAQRQQDALDRINEAKLDIWKQGEIGEDSDARKLGLVELEMIEKENALENLSKRSAEAAGLKDSKDGGGEVKRPGALTSLGKELKDIEDKGRSEVNSAKIVDNYSDVKANFQSMLEFYPFNDKSATTALVSSFARVMDPGSKTDQGEIKNAQNTQTFLAQLGYDMDSLMTGKQNIGPEAKAAMIRAAGAKYNVFGKEVDSYIGRQRGLVKARQGDPDSIFAETSYEPFNFVDWHKGNAANQYTIDEQLTGTPTQPTIPDGLRGVPMGAIEAEINRRRLSEAGE